MMKKQGFIFILSILLLFIANQIIIGFLAVPPSVNPASLTNNTKIKPQKLFEKTWKEIDSGFYDASLNSQDWSYWKKHYKGKIKTDEDAKVAIDTMLASLDDDYSRYLNKQEYAEQNSSIESKISGIGVNIINDSGKIKIYSVIDNTPAKEYGLKPNDIILKVDNKNVSGMNIADVATLVRGEEGSKVTIEILRHNQKITKKIPRKTIKIESVKSSVKNNIGYIQVSSFIGTSTASEFLSALDKTKDSKGIILDLRGNTGGLLANAIFIANMFMDNGTIVNIVSRDGKIENIKAQANSTRINKPVVVLVDGASASASEILSGALKDHHRAILVGTRTFGKGMVQRIIPLPNATGLNLTIAKYLTPNGSDINKKGINPDYVVKYTEKDFLTHHDPQKEQAEKILNNMLKK
ncbi:MAG: S41 family peptidase [Candidatus Gastranaerophilaceae bacterium]